MSTRRAVNTVFLAFLAALAVTILADSSRIALAVNAPLVTIEDALVYRNVGDDNAGGDFLVLVRGELPLSGWCSQLSDTDGCPTAPTNPTSLPNGAAFIRFYTGCGAVSTCQTTGTLRGQTPIRRIGHILTGVYRPPGHGIAWGSASDEAVACIEAPDTFFDTTEVACAGVSWRPSTIEADSDTRGESVPVLTGDLIAVMKDLESARQDALGTLVEEERITAAGRVFALEAFSLMNAIAPQAFLAGAVTGDLIGTPFAESTPAIQDVLATAQAGSDALEGGDQLAREYLGTDIATLGKVLTAGGSLVLALLAYTAGGRHWLAGYLGFAIPWVFGAWLWVPFSWIAVVIIILIVLAGAWLTSLLPDS